METKDSNLNFESPWNMSDIVLVAEEKKFHSHRCVLSLWSPVFDRMFNGDFREKNSKEITLPGKKASEIHEMLELIYDRRKQINDDNCDFLLRLAEEFQMDQLKEECIKYLTTADKNGINALKYLNVANRFELEGLQKECIHSAKGISTELLQETQMYQKLEDESKIAIATARLRMLEDLLRKYESLSNYMVKYLYEKAHDAYIDFLRDHGLEESCLSKCENFEKHRSQYIGTAKKFCLHCSACRMKTNAVKTFTVRSDDIINTLEKIYELMYKE